MKLIDGNKPIKEVKPEKEAVFTTGVGLYSNGKDFDVKINGEIVLWFMDDGIVRYNKDTLRDAGFKAPEEL